MYLVAHRKVYTKPIRKLHTSFLEKTDLMCSLSTFFKYKPFYIVPPSEREKESCLCIRCTNAHYFLKGINNYRKGVKLPPHVSVTEFLKLNFLSPGFMANGECYEKVKLYPEFTDVKTVNFYVFEKKEETYYKNGEMKCYTRTARVDKNMSVSVIVYELLSKGEKYLIHRLHVNSIANVFPLMREVHRGNDGRYIELDFSENVSLKPKFEVQEAHFSGKQFALHCSIVEPGDTKYVYHMSDDTTHDASFVHEVLEDIFIKWDIKNETVMIKSDNAPSQYKDKCAFWSLQYLADTYNIKIIRVYGAAGHGKGLIDAMSSFGVKSILRIDTISFETWFENGNAMCEYLALRGDSRMMYVHLDGKVTDERRCKRQAKVVKPCMIGHLFVYKPKCDRVLMREYLCDCEQCLSFNFDSCNRSTELDKKAKHLVEDEHDDSVDDECILDEDFDNEDKISQIYEFIEVPAFVALLSFNTVEPFFVLKVLSKGKADETLRDRYGNVILQGEYYLKGVSAKSSIKRFKKEKVLDSRYRCLCSS